jgi:hypothetical protein
MVFAVNPGPENSASSFDQFKANAISEAAQLANSKPATSAYPSHTPTIREVQVGPNGNFTYDPPAVEGLPGDTLRFIL